MAKSIKDKLFDQFVSLVTRDLTKTAYGKVKKIISDQAKNSKKLKKNPSDTEEDLEP
jgi:hypothetical protein